MYKIIKGSSFDCSILPGVAVYCLFVVVSGMLTRVSVLFREECKALTDDGTQQQSEDTFLCCVWPIRGV